MNISATSAAEPSRSANGSQSRRSRAARPAAARCTGSFILKGEGWYVTDYPSEARKKALESEKSSAGGDGKKGDGKKGDDKKRDDKKREKSEKKDGAPAKATTSASAPASAPPTSTPSPSSSD
jgi:hypothetical protein